ncbi:class I SAM-dependent methyltransferase [Paenibacillus sp. 481]|uniref:class I SAM-dependent methyltransferase n=1 Tax=Paenibacillus sp. 481 TaxID=2835869 RepID=UPI001E43E7E6|nr:class I SAM-dependent methyltransferase [Paenibacillus sp. 481]UHA73064.1 class I SAM-dependent methyltransferase [Paenibacillus sp. 481]
MIITTGDATSPHIIEQARQLAVELGYPFLERGNDSLPRMQRKYADDEFLVLSNAGARFKKLNKADITYHPSMAYLRAKRLLSGESDPMIEASGVQPGDTVLDCTAGLGSDALVFAVAVGESGSVTAVESEHSLYAVVHMGLQLYETENEIVSQAMKRIEMRYAHHGELLASLPDRSFDVVYFDPMFRSPVEESSSINPLRVLANHDALAHDVIAEACRVARKSVVMKELRYSKEFARLGFTRLVRTGSKLAYGVIEIADNNSE